MRYCIPLRLIFCLIGLATFWGVFYLCGEVLPKGWFASPVRYWWTLPMAMTALALVMSSCCLVVAAWHVDAPFEKWFLPSRSATSEMRREKRQERRRYFLERFYEALLSPFQWVRDRLIEVLIVLCIIAIVAALILPVICADPLPAYDEALSCPSCGKSTYTEQVIPLGTGINRSCLGCGDNWRVRTIGNSKQGEEE